MLDWVAGSDVEATMPKKTMGANLHGGLALIDYGNESEQEAYHTLFFSTTEGFLHAFNVQPSDSRLKHDDSYSLELFRFIPQELLKSSIQQWAHVSGLMRMPDFDHGNQSSEHKGGFSYGLDGPLTVWKHDAFKEQINGDYAGYALQDGIIEAQSRPTFPDSDLVFIYAGMRRGGHHLYALDVTSVSTSQAVNTLDPRLMFVIKGGKDAPKGSPYLQLGQTWSKPALGRIKVNGEVKPVLVIGGGYDADLYDQGFGKTNIGNQVYIIDAQTGYLYWAASSNFNSSATSSGLHKVPGMEYAIPSEIKVVDSDADGLTDLLYFGDLGGQLWRVKINARYDPDEKGFAKATPILKAGLTWQHQVKQDRRFFYPPSVSFMGAGVYAVSMVSGNPAAPFERSVQDGLFVVYDKPNGEIDQAGLDVCDLYLHKASKQDSTNCNADTAKKGWKLMFDQTLGERAVGTPIVFNHNLFFATFLPPEKAQGRLRQCEITLGSSRVYGLNIRAEYIDQPSGYFQRYELVKKNEFHLATRPTSRFAQSLRYIIRKKGRSVSSLSLLVGNKLIAELEMPKARITKVRWVPGGRY